MLRIKSVWFLVLILISTVLSGVGRSNLESIIEIKRNESSQKNESLTKIFQDKSFVLVAGFMNEQKNDYFDEMVKVLVEQYGVPVEKILVIKPESNTAIEKNSKIISQTILDFASRNGIKKNQIVMIGHSKGAVEAVLAGISLRNVQIIDKIIGIQGVFGGSLIADLICGTSCGLEGKVGFVKRVILKILGLFYRMKIRKLEGIRSLRLDVPNEVMERTLRALPESEIADLQNKIFYLRSTVEVEDSFSSLDRISVDFIGQVLESPNDNTITLEDQIPLVGQEIGTVNASHSELISTEKMPVDRVELAKERIALVLEIIFEIIYDSELHPNLCNDLF